MAYDVSGKRIWVAGHRGMAGSAIVRRLEREDCQILTVGRDDLDLTRQADVQTWLEDMQPDTVVLAAGKVGGIHANSTYPADFLLDNVVIATNVIAGAHRAGVDRLLYLGSSCIYPRLAPQPIKETSLLGGALEPTNEWYAVAKIVGVKLCQALQLQHGADYISAMPTNLYGQGDNYHPENSHVIAALIRRFHEAKMRGDTDCVVWGTGSPLREFLFVDDLADACVFLLRHYHDPTPINVGSGEEMSIAGLAEAVRAVVGFEGALVFDRTKPDGTPRKMLDTERLRTLGWAPTVEFADGLARAYAWFLDHVNDLSVGQAPASDEGATSTKPGLARSLASIGTAGEGL